MNNNQQETFETKVINNLCSKIGGLEGNLTIAQTKLQILSEQYRDLEQRYNELLEKQESKTDNPTT